MFSNWFSLSTVDADPTTNNNDHIVHEPLNGTENFTEIIKKKCKDNDDNCCDLECVIEECEESQSDYDDDSCDLDEYMDEDELFEQDDRYDTTDGFVVSDDELSEEIVDISLYDVTENLQSLSVAAQDKQRRARFEGTYGDDEWCSEDDDDSEFAPHSDESSSDESSELDVSCCSDLDSGERSESNECSDNNESNESSESNDENGENGMSDNDCGSEHNNNCQQEEEIVLPNQMYYEASSKEGTAYSAHQ